ncbi:DsbA family protein [Frigoribacterium faeni]|uniref:DsbA family protein n=1 Tax=Frigoribacterium faeni TaxID=145483 RepID=UPI001FAE1A90|nr:thioredoxin domain-containing protein [Frigoribacterium faeni]MCJ0701953.1 DsbA family protein [Frigoribacterium faeni]
MTDNTPDDKILTKNQRRAAARQKAQLARKKQKRRQKTGRLLLQGGIALALVAVVVIVVVVITNSIKPAGPGPANMASDGIRIGQDFVAETTPALAADDEPVPSETTAASDTVDIVVYLDYLCPICGQFEEANNDYIAGLVDSGAATVEYHPVAILTNSSVGTRYSNRAANAAACVANYSPNSFFDFNTALFDQQPEEGTRGLDDATLSDIATGIEGVVDPARITTCIDDEEFASWVTNATERAVDGPIPNSTVDALPGTPLVLVNGQQYEASTPFTNEEFRNFVVTAAGNSYADSSTATPTPTPTESGAPAEPAESEAPAATPAATPAG